RLVPQLLLLLSPQHALVGEQQELPQAVHGLALVELAEDPPTVVPALQVAEDEDRLDQPAVLLQRPGQPVLGPNPTLTLVANSGREPIGWSLGKMGPPRQA